MRGTVLITRPIEDAKIIADLVTQKGYAAFTEPFLKVVFEETSLPDLKIYEALIFTSANGVRAFCDKAQERNLPIFTIGKNTAEAARQAGFKIITNADGDVDALTKILPENMSEKPYLHIRGKHISRSLSPQNQDLSIDEKILYHTEKIEEISDECLEMICRGKFSHILFFSERTAESFVNYIRTQKLIKTPNAQALGLEKTPNAQARGLEKTPNAQALGFEKTLERTKALCLGASMVQCLSVLPWQEIVIAERPTRNGIMALLD